jgi:hypothetical protein
MGEFDDCHPLEICGKIAIIVAGDTIDFEATNEAAYQASLTQLIPCENCGRKFAPERLGVHQRSCTRDNPGKRVEKPKPPHHQPQLATTMAAKAKMMAEQQGRA